MKLLPLVWAMLWRRRMRTVLTFGSIAAAFLLFGLLHAFASLFDASLDFGGADKLMTSHRYGFLKPLPYAYRSHIEALPGVKSVTPFVIFPFTYGDGAQSTQPSLAVDPFTAFDHDNRFVVPPEHLRALQENRTGMIVGRQLADRFGWKIGDRVPLKSSWIKRKDGADFWELDVVGFFEFNKEVLGEGVSAMRVFLRYDYLDEARVKPGEVDLFFMSIEDPAQAPAIIKAIDTRFQNSANPTRTQTETEQQRAQIAQVGNIGLIITAILSAVFFTLVVVAGNTMMRAFRERIPELAVLKTLGFTDRTVAGLVAAESVLLCVGAGLAGLALAWLLARPIATAIAAVLPFFRLDAGTVGLGALLALALGAAAALVPAWQSARLTVVDALAVR